jgi:hypothetical protein
LVETFHIIFIIFIINILMITFKEYTNWRIDEADAPPAGGAPAAPPPDAGAAPPVGGDMGGAPPMGDMGGGGADMGLGGSLGPGGDAAGGAPTNTKLLASDVWEALDKYFQKLDQNKTDLQQEQPPANMT